MDYIHFEAEEENQKLNFSDEEGKRNDEVDSKNKRYSKGM